MSFPLYYQTDYITNFRKFCELLQIPQFPENYGAKAEQELSFKVPSSLLDRIEKGNVNDPILLQFLPQINELNFVQGFSNDPLKENDALLQPGVLQKYQKRALILMTDLCVAQCRFCFRRTGIKNQSLISCCLKTEFPHHIRENSEENNSHKSELSLINFQTNITSFFQKIRNDSTITEIIFSGGDPLMISNELLKNLLYYIKTMEHVKRVRFHSRLPVLVPERIDAHFPLGLNFHSSRSAESSKQVYYIVFHINHPNEINDRVRDMFHLLRSRGVVLMSQTVLLKRINDQPEILEALFEQLVNCQVIPYYLHQLDKVQGAAHFEVDVTKGLKIMEELRQRLPGYAVPKYVREIPGLEYKRVLEKPF